MLRTAGSFATSASGAVRSPHHLSASGEDEPALTQASEPPKGTDSRLAKSVPATDPRTVSAAALHLGGLAGLCTLKVRAWCEREAWQFEWTRRLRSDSQPCTPSANVARLSIYLSQAYGQSKPQEATVGRARRLCLAGRCPRQRDARNIVRIPPGDAAQSSAVSRCATPQSRD